MQYDFLNGKTILVTGGTGSFGQKFIRVLLAETQVGKVIVFSRDELKQSKMTTAIPDPEERLRFFLGDVRDLQRLQRAFHGVDFIVHAAALKQVPMLEYNPFEAVRTNIIGTQNIIEAAIDQHVKKVMLVSTDKAAHPANLYGATKLCAEKLMIAGNSYAAGRTALGVVRYGNVFGSRGSLVELIEQQRVSGEVTLTHEEMTRFWITIDQGVRLVLMALERLCGGEIFIPKIPSMRVKDLIQSLAPECAIRIIGLRPGEKINEVLITPEEARRTKEFDDYYVILPDQKGWAGLKQYHDGRTLPRDFFYASHINSDWLDADRFRALLQQL